MGDLNKPRPGCAASSHKGQRAIVLTVCTESKILPGSVDVRPPSEVLVDYHQYMSAELYNDYMKQVLPMILATTPDGRQPVLVIDNATIHNTLVETLPSKSSKKPNLLAFLQKYQVTTAPGATNKQLCEEVESVMDARGGRDVLNRYLIDEYMASIGVKILRLPPYHCQFSPIELTWNQLKSHFRMAGNTTDKLEAVGKPAKECLRNISKTQIAWTYEHMAQIEEGIKLLIDKDEENWNWDGDASTTFEFLYK